MKAALIAIMVVAGVTALLIAIQPEGGEEPLSELALTQEERAEERDVVSVPLQSTNNVVVGRVDIRETAENQTRIVVGVTEEAGAGGEGRGGIARVVSIQRGTCEQPRSVVVPLSPLIEGRSETIIGIQPTALAARGDLLVVIEEIGTGANVISCTPLVIPST